MTTSSPPSVKDLLKKTLELHERALAGDTDALDQLAGSAAARAKAAEPEKAKEPEKPKPKMLVDLKEKTILRPNGEAYYIRKVGEHQDVQLMRKARETKQPVLLYGQPGCGKTALFEAAFFDADQAKDPQGLGYRYVPGSGDTEVADFVGGYIPKPNGDFAWIDGPLIDAMNYGLPLLVDEVALIDPKVMSVVYSVMDGREELNVTANPEVGIITAKPGFVVFGACNPRAPGARMSEALLSRFALHMEVAVDFALMTSMGVDRKLVQAAQNLKAKYDKGEISWYPAIRELLASKKILETFGEETMLANMASQAPEMDRDEIANILSRKFGHGITPLTIA